ncbi:GroES-like protein [Xylaria sp. FL1777]|nr:GroES-like protein [Xylaria sp. FL1777]
MPLTAKCALLRVGQRYFISSRLTSARFTTTHYSPPKSSITMSIQQLQASKLGGPFLQVTAPIPKPNADEISIRPRAVSLNPIDWKNLRFGALVNAWPAVLGIEGAGVVESVGDAVSSFKPGDEVMCWVQRSQFNGAFQDVFTAREASVARKPAAFSFEEAASLPIGYLTAAAAVAVGLKVTLPGLSKSSTSTTPLQSILVLGGSSSIGSAAIQLLRIALPFATIITTSSVAHHDHLKSLGATRCLERSAQEDATALKAASPGGSGVDAVLDAVGAGAEAPAVYETIKSDGPRLYSLVITRPGIELPAGIQTTLVGGQDIINYDPSAMKYLHKLLDDGKYKLPVKVEVVGKGLQSIEGNLDRVMKVSGTKLVVSL